MQEVLSLKPEEWGHTNPIVSYLYGLPPLVWRDMQVQLVVYETDIENVRELGGFRPTRSGRARQAVRCSSATDRRALGGMTKLTRQPQISRLAEVRTLSPRPNSPIWLSSSRIGDRTASSPRSIASGVSSYSSRWNPRTPSRAKHQHSSSTLPPCGGGRGGLEPTSTPCTAC
jgi:hypothetical protein